MNSRTPTPLRLLTLLVATAVTVSLAASAAPAQAAPKKCPKGKTAWKLDGCVPRVKLGAGKAPAASTMARTWLANASRPAPGTRLRLAPALRRAIPRLGRGLAKSVARVGAARSSARIAQRGPVVERHEGVVGRLELGDGAFAEGRIRARVYEDDSKEFDAEIEMRDGKGNTVRYAPKLHDMVQTKPVGCPTAAGVVTVEETAEMAGTVVRLKGGRVRGAKTVRDGWRIDARGQVGTDARLRSVAADVTLTMKSFERGLQQQTKMSASMSLSRNGAPVLKGTPTIDVSVKSASATRAEEREYEIALARSLAGAPEIAETLSSMGARARADLLEAERRWYDLPNDCARIAWTPATGGELAVDETRRVTGQVIAQRDGRVATGRIAVGQVSPGRLIPITPAFSPGAPASFIAAGGVPDSSDRSVYAQAVATSTAGRAQLDWSARAKPVSLPQAFSGTVAATSTTTGMKREFSGSAAFTRTSVVRGPDGSLTAWYELTSASLNQAKQILGAFEGCRYEANGSGGYVDSGDLELRVLPGGEVVYALLYDLKVASWYIPTDCPPDSGDPFDGEIAAFLNTRRPGPVEAQLRPAGANYRLEAASVGDVTAEAGISTTASWSLMPE